MYTPVFVSKKYTIHPETLKNAKKNENDGWAKQIFVGCRTQKGRSQKDMRPFLLKKKAFSLLYRYGA